MSVHIGRYLLHETPSDPIQYVYLGADGDPLDITDYATATFVAVAPDRTSAGQPADIVTPAAGLVSTDWVGMTSQTGTWWGTFVLAPGPLHSVELAWTVTAGPGSDPDPSNAVPAPTITIE